MSEPIEIDEEKANQIRELLGDTEYEIVVLKAIRKDAAAQEYVLGPLAPLKVEPVHLEAIRPVALGYCYVQGRCLICCDSAGCRVVTCW